MDGWLRAHWLCGVGLARIPRKKGTGGDGTSSQGKRECVCRRLQDGMDGWDNLGLGFCPDIYSE